MREIKFRGKSVETGKMVYGSLINNLFYDTKTKQPICYIVDPSIGEYSSLDEVEDIAIEVEPESIGQYTEVHDDEEGNEVYNGDIVEITHEERLLRCFVKYEGSGFMLVSDELEDGYIWMSDLIECDRSYFWVPDSIVIGNIHDHPHLLNQE
ncbi:YopX family protein [Brevibacillus laterosporus]|uniref:YopX family protein n=1 Tax=Brevibacillus laterosporus TaxID=1465 RepID=UPI002E1FCD8B|nr:YopX family protein [Brevibacillus laterosporus]